MPGITNKIMLPRVLARVVKLGGKAALSGAKGVVTAPFSAVVGGVSKLARGILRVPVLSLLSKNKLAGYLGAGLLVNLVAKVPFVGDAMGYAASVAGSMGGPVVQKASGAASAFGGAASSLGGLLGEYTPTVVAKYAQAATGYAQPIMNGAMGYINPIVGAVSPHIASMGEVIGNGSGIVNQWLPAGLVATGIAIVGYEVFFGSGGKALREFYAEQKDAVLLEEKASDKEEEVKKASAADKQNQQKVIEWVKENPRFLRHADPKLLKDATFLVKLVKEAKPELKIQTYEQVIEHQKIFGAKEKEAKAKTYADKDAKDKAVKKAKGADIKAKKDLLIDLAKVAHPESLTAICAQIAKEPALKKEEELFEALVEFDRTLLSIDKEIAQDEKNAIAKAVFAQMDPSLKENTEFLLKRVKKLEELVPEIIDSGVELNERFLNNKSFMVGYAKYNVEAAFGKAKNWMKGVKEFARVVLIKKPELIEEIKTKYTTGAKFLADVVKENPDVLAHVKGPRRAFDYFWLTLLELSGRAEVMQYMPEEGLIKKKEFLLKAVKLNADVLKQQRVLDHHAPELADPKTAKELVERNPEALRFVSSDLKKDAGFVRSVLGSFTEYFSPDKDLLEIIVTDPEFESVRDQQGFFFSVEQKFIDENPEFFADNREAQAVKAARKGSLKPLEALAKEGKLTRNVILSVIRAVHEATKETRVFSKYGLSLPEMYRRLITHMEDTTNPRDTRELLEHLIKEDPDFIVEVAPMSPGILSGKNREAAKNKDLVRQLAGDKETRKALGYMDASLRKDQEFADELADEFGSDIYKYFDKKIDPRSVLFLRRRMIKA